METFDAMKLRKSIRGYSGKIVEAEKLERILWAGNRAPLGVPFHMTVVQNVELMKQINDKTLTALKESPFEFIQSMVALPGFQPLYGAPVLIVLSADDPLRGQTSVNCAAAFITLAATDLGLAACYVASPIQVLGEDGNFYNKLDLPMGYNPLAGVLIGYAAEDTGERFTRPRAEAMNTNYVY
jgi:nitroreductase